MSKEKRKWVCSQCGSNKIQQQSWTYINTDKLADYQEDDLYYCDDCNTTEVKAVEQSEFTNNMTTMDKIRFERKKDKR